MTTRTETDAKQHAEDPAPPVGASSGEQPQADKPARLNVNINAATEQALNVLVEREGVTITEAVRRLIGYGMVVYRADKIDSADVLIRRDGQTERVIIL